MAKSIVRNVSGQPVYLNLPGGRSRKIAARTTTEIEDADLRCPEAAFYRNRGSLVVLQSSAKTKKAHSPRASAPKKGGRGKGKAEAKGESGSQGGN